MPKTTESSPPFEGVRVRGMFRIQLRENDEIVGDSDWVPNRVVNEGFLQYLTRTLGAQANSRQIALMMLGTGTAPATTDTSLNGELNTATYTRTSVNVSLVGSTAVEFRATWASANAHITQSVVLQNIGIIYNTTSAGTLFAGTNYIQSTWNTNQDVNATYRINFS